MEATPHWPLKCTVEDQSHFEQNIYTVNIIVVFLPMFVHKYSLRFEFFLFKNKCIHFTNNQLNKL